MLQWEPAMATNVAAIDNQHKELVRQVNELVEAMKAGKGRQRIGDVLVFLGKYAVDHFGMEESLMKTHAYPGYEKHKAVHEAFKQDFGQLAKEFGVDGQNLTLTIQVQRRVLDWLKAHILQVDKELGAFLKGKGVA